MTMVNIRLNRFNDVKILVDIITEYPIDVDLISGRYTIDAKSLLGIYSLDLSKAVKLAIHSDDCEELLAALQIFAC